VVAAAVAVLAITAGAPVLAPPVSGASKAAGPQEYSCPLFPASNPLNQDISHAPVDPRSAAYIASIGLTGHLHPDFGTNPSYGIPYAVVGSQQHEMPITFTAYNGESDPGPYPIPANARIEGPPAGEEGDRHVLVLQRGSCKLFELYAARRSRAGWEAGSGAVFNLRSNALRPEGWTSADAAGLPMFPGLVRYDEVAAGEIRHAIRFTAPKTTRSFIWPARHFSSRVDDANLPSMGLRLRLKADFDISGFSKETQVILRALKKYGMILADNGLPWFITGAGDPHWNADGMTAEMRRILGSNFEVVDTSSMMRGPNSGASVGKAQ